MPLNKDDLLSTLSNNTNNFNIEIYNASMNEILNKLQFVKRLNVNIFQQMAYQQFSAILAKGWIDKNILKSKEALLLLDGIKKKINNIDLNKLFSNAQKEGQNIVIPITASDYRSNLQKIISQLRDKKSINIFSKEDYNLINKEAYGRRRMPSFYGSGGTSENQSMNKSIEKRRKNAVYLTLDKNNKDTPFYGFAEIIIREISAISTSIFKPFKDYKIEDFLFLVKFVSMFRKLETDLINSFKITHTILSRKEDSVQADVGEDVSKDIFDNDIASVVFSPNQLSASTSSISINLKLENNASKDLRRLIIDKKKQGSGRFVIAAIFERLKELNTVETQKQKEDFSDFLDILSENSTIEIRRKVDVSITSTDLSELKTFLETAETDEGVTIWNNTSLQNGSNVKLTMKKTASQNNNSIVKKSYSTAQPYYTTKAPDGSEVNFSITDLVLGGGYLNHKGKKFKPKKWKPKSVYKSKKGK